MSSQVTPQEVVDAFTPEDSKLVLNIKTEADVRLAEQAVRLAYQTASDRMNASLNCSPNEREALTDQFAFDMHRATVIKGQWGCATSGEKSLGYSTYEDFHMMFLQMGYWAKAACDGLPVEFDIDALKRYLDSPEQVRLFGEQVITLTERAVRHCKQTLQATPEDQKLWYPSSQARVEAAKEAYQEWLQLTKKDPRTGQGPVTRTG